MGNCLFLRAQGWGIDRQVRNKLQIPGGVLGGGMVTGRIEPFITFFCKLRCNFDAYYNSRLTFYVFQRVYIIDMFLPSTERHSYLTEQ